MFSKYKKDNIMYWYTKLYGPEDNTHYSLEELFTESAQYNIMLSERSNGKSYAMKKFILLNAYHFKNEFVYVRRLDTDIKTASIIGWFADMPIAEYTDGEYEGVDYWQGDIYFYSLDSEGKKVKGQCIGHTMPVSTYGKYKSRAYPKVTDIVFEEFITDSTYLFDEVTIFMQLVSTIARDRDVRVWMLGNKISQYCPYVLDWGLTNALSQKQGTIDVYTFTREVDNDIIKTKIAVENCTALSHKSKMFFGKTAENINGGKWEGETKEVPKLPMEYEKYTMIYECVMSDCGFDFLVQLLINDDGGQIAYVKPFKYKREILRHITTQFSDNPWYTQRFRDDIPAEVMLRQLISNSKVCFSHNLCGNNFYQMLKNRKGMI